VWTARSGRYYITSFDSAMSYLASDEFRDNVKNAAERHTAAAAAVAAQQQLVPQ
jgi:hypothetical protein